MYDILNSGGLFHSDEEYHFDEWVYLHYIFSDLIYKGSHWRFNVGKDICIICVDPQILKDLPKSQYLFCRAMMGGCKYNPESQIKSLKQLRQHINLKILLNRKKSQKTDGWIFRHTHEVTITHVKLNYIKAILVHESNYKIVKLLIENFGLDIKIGVFKCNQYNYKELFESIL